MAENSKSVRQNLFTKKFRDFCKKEFSKVMEELEKERLKTLKILKIIIVSFAILIIASVTSSFILFETLSSASLNIIVFLFIGFFIIYTLLKNKYKKNAKKKVLDKLLSFVGDFKIVEIDKYHEISKIKELKLFDYFNSWHFDDCINGVYKGLDVEIREIKLKKVQRSGKKKTVIPVFYGLYLKVPSTKPFEGFTIIKPEYKSCSYGEKIKLEDIEFEKMFNVKGDNQIEARYLITTAFMNRLVKLKKKKLIEDISLSFENGFIHIGIHSTKDYFEMPLLKPATDIFNYRKIVLDLMSVLSVIDCLKLEQKIGM